MKETEPVRAISDSEFWEHAYHGVRKSRRCLPNPRWRLGHFELDRVFRQFLPRKSGLRLLEVGCGSSIWLPYFVREFGYKVSGVDYTLNGVEQAKENLARAGCTGNIIHADFFDIEPRLQNQFDFVFSFGVIEHFERPGDVVARFASCLREGGITITYIPNIPGFIGPLLKWVDRPFYQTHKHIDKQELVRYHTEAGQDVFFSSYIQLLDLNQLHLGKLGPRWAHLFHGAFAALDLPVLLADRFLGLRVRSPRFSSSILVLARKGPRQG